MNSKFMNHNELPIPSYFETDKVAQVWKVPYQERATDAERWSRNHNIAPVSNDEAKICLMLIDVQNSFCIPEFELYVGGRSGTGAVDDNRRLCSFIYRNLDIITEICPTMDTHRTMQIFHSAFLVNEKGEHPAPFTMVTKEDIEQGVWKFNPNLFNKLGVDEEQAEKYLLHYTSQLKENGKYELTIWPYHTMLGGIGHALVSSVEEAIFFHSTARHSQPNFQMKGNNPFTENYSVLKPEVMNDHNGKLLARKNITFIKELIEFDAVIIAGQAKSHCVASTVDDLLDEMLAFDEELVKKLYLLEDCTSPVVIPGVADYTEQADATFQRFADAGMNIVRSTDPIQNWAGFGK